MRKGPLADSYPAAVGLVVCSLVPYLGLSAALLPVLPQVGKALHLSTPALEVAVAMSTAAYAVGTVFAVQFAQRFRPRRMLVLYETLFVVASFLAATTHDGGVFVGAFVVQGLCTSLMLIAAVPPLVTAWPPRKMPVTGGIMNLCIFGAVAVGPTVGAEAAAALSWHLLFWGVAGVAVLALGFSLLTFEDDPPADTRAPWDLVALAMALVGCSAAFYGAGDLEATGSPGVARLVPLCGGFALVGAVVVYEYRVRRPLMPVRAFATTVPVAGITLALFASAAGFSLMELVLTALKTTSSPADAALVFLPEFVGAAALAALFASVFRTRHVSLLAFGGMPCIAAAAAVFLVWGTSGSPVVAVGTGLLGIGVGASVSPALFMAGFSLKSDQLQRVFALIELLRGVAAFLVAPVLLFLVADVWGAKPSGFRAAVGICLGLAVTGLLLAYAIFASGKAGLETPDVDRWQEEGEPAWSSPPLLARLRRPAPPVPGPGRDTGGRRSAA